MKIRILSTLLILLSITPVLAKREPDLYKKADLKEMEHWVDSIFDSMSVKERIGQLFVLAVDVNTSTKNKELIRKYVEENYRKAITLGETARKFYLSAGRFSHFFKREVGISFMNYVNLYRVMKAEEMLKETELPVSEIAFLNGFGSISQFNRVFRSATGRKPRDVRSP